MAVDIKDTCLSPRCSFKIMQPWVSLVKASNYQIYVSRSLDPFLNLSIEHFLLQKSPPHSTVLFLYVNRPCVVIGRNQNPWLEVDLKLLKQPRPSAHTGAIHDIKTTSPWENVPLVRRRSGGGTVFHDEGNLNYSVICPTADFSRDKHAEMVTSAIRQVNLRARVNERHDIVLDQGSALEENEWPDATNMHQTIFHRESKDSPPLKISGSAYKLTRQRSLHHGTCLLASGDLPKISQYLNSPARPFIKARGVESVRSPIGNVYGNFRTSTMSFNNKLIGEIIKAFSKMYGLQKGVRRFPSLRSRAKAESRFDRDGEWTTGSVDDSVRLNTDIKEGMDEMQVS